MQSVLEETIVPEVKQNLNDYIEKCKERLNCILNTIGWNEADVFKNYNSVSVASKSTAKVASDSESASENEPEFPPSSNNTNSVTLAKLELQQIVNDVSAEIPNTFADLQVNFNREQKLAIYEYVINKTGHLTEPEKLLVGAGNQTLAEIVTIKKREKKKRRRYRLTKPTFIEEVRSVVDLQMQALEQFLGKTAGEKCSHKGEGTTKINDVDHEHRYERESKRSRERFDNGRTYSSSQKHSKERYRSRSPCKYTKKDEKRRDRSRSHNPTFWKDRHRPRSRSRTERHDGRERSRSHRSRRGATDREKFRRSRSDSPRRNMKNDSDHRERSKTGKRVSKRSRSRSRSRNSKHKKHHKRSRSRTPKSKHKKR